MSIGNRGDLVHKIFAREGGNRFAGGGVGDAVSERSVFEGLLGSAVGVLWLGSHTLLPLTSFADTMGGSCLSLRIQRGWC